MAESSEARTETPSPALEQLRAADGQLQASTALLLDRQVPVALALPHVRATWDALARTALATAKVPTGPSTEPDAEPAKVIATHAPHWLTPAATEAARTVPAADTRAEASERAHWIQHVRGLAEACTAAELELLGADRRREAKRRWLRRIGYGFVALIPLVGLMIVFPPEFRDGPWRGAYYDNQDFAGEPQLRRDGDLHFKWDDTPPLTDMPDDAFSARWDTCMTLDEPLDMRFRLVSDDGSRLFVDGELIVDNWGKHGERARGGRKELPAGVHHVRVEYIEYNGSAEVSLVVSLRGERPDSLPTRILTYPGDEIDDNDPCGHLRW